MAAPAAADKVQRRITLSSNFAARHDECNDDPPQRIGEALVVESRDFLPLVDACSKTAGVTRVANYDMGKCACAA
jgi:hypothetical protein